VLLLYVNILAVLSLFIGYFIPKLSGDFARLFREAPQLFSRFNSEWVPRIGAWVDNNLGAGESAELDTATPTATDGGRRAREIVVEPLPGGRFRINLENVASRCSRCRRALRDRAAALRGDGVAHRREVGALDQEVVDRAGQVHEGESRRALEYGQKFVTAVVSGIGSCSWC